MISRKNQTVYIENDVEWKRNRQRNKKGCVTKCVVRLWLVVFFFVLFGYSAHTGENTYNEGGGLEVSANDTIILCITFYLDGGFFIFIFVYYDIRAWYS